jgi:hypothetical protein
MAALLALAKPKSSILAAKTARQLQRYIGRIGRRTSASRIEPLSARRKIGPFFGFLVGIFREAKASVPAG